ncbi:hypothetical protein MRX96_035032 [Rhipicephalus microplus]
MSEEKLPLIKNAMPLEDRKYTIRELKYEELPRLVELWKAIGFMISGDLIDSLWKCDRAGIIAAVAEDGEVIGSCCAPFVGEGMAKLWLHGLQQQYRNQGLGTQLADRAMEHIGEANAYTLCIPEHEHIYLNKYQFNVSSRLFQILGPAVPRLTGVITSLPGVRVMESERGSPRAAARVRHRHRRLQQVLDSLPVGIPHNLER